MQYANKLNRQAKNYMIYSNAIVNTTVDTEIIDNIIYYQSNKKYYLPNKGELLKLSDGKYFPMTTQTQKLKEVLITKFKISPLVIGSLLYELFHSVLIEER